MARSALFYKNQTGGFSTVEDMSRSTGNRFYVDSGASAASDSTGYGLTPDAPFATIDYAVGQCTATNGDIIYVMPGHAESLTGATSLVVDVAGVSIIGLGSGAARPRLTYTTAAGATLSVTAANCRLENLWLLSAYTNGITVGVTVGASADGLVMKDIVMQESLNTQEFLTAVSIAAACADVTIDGFRFYGVLGGTDLSCIVLAGAADRFTLSNSYMYGDWSASVVDGLGAASTGVLVQNVVFYQDDAAAGLGIDFHDSSLGFISDCRAMNKKDTVEAFTGNLMGYAECYGSNAVNVQGILKPVADA